MSFKFPLCNERGTTLQYVHLWRDMNFCFRNLSCPEMAVDGAQK